MKTNLFSLSLLITSVCSFSQEVQQDSLNNLEKLDELVIKAIRVNKNAAVAHSNLSKKEIAQRNLGQDIPILMNYLPSVTTSSDAGAGIGYTYMRVRGSDASRINVTVNGIPYNDAESHGTYWVNMGDFASSTENLQLQRGVGTSTNGPGAFGASLNILTDKSSEIAGGEISNSIGSFGTKKHTLKFTTGKINNQLELSGRLSNIYSDGYVDRAFSDLNSYFLQGTYSNKNTLIKGLVFGGKEKTYQSWYGLTLKELRENRRQNPYTYDNETDNYEQNHHQLHISHKFNENWSTNLGLNYTKGKGYYEQYKSEANSVDYKELIANNSDLIVRRWLDNDFYVMNYNINYKNDYIDLIGGLSTSNYKGDHFGEIIWGSDLAEGTNIRDKYYFNNAVKTDHSAFLKTTLNITNQLVAYIDLQGRFINYKTKGSENKQLQLDINKTYNFFNPKLGLTYNANNHNNFYLSFAVANREPNRNDLINEIKTPETLYDFETGWRFQDENIKINTNLYYMGYRNQLILTGAIDDVGSPIRTNSGKSFRSGIEIDAEFNISDKLFIRPNFAYNYHRNIAFKSQINGEIVNLGDTPISFSPDIIAGNIITYKPKSNLYISLLSKYVGQQYMSNLKGKVSGDEYSDLLNDYFTSDVNISYEIKTSKIAKKIIFNALINNILNTKYVDRGYFGTYDDNWSNPNTITTLGYSYYYPQATRNFLIGVTMKF